jgi:putative ABC transport system permease protein
MMPADLARFTLRTLAGYRLRAVLTLLAMAIGSASVVVLTALGEGARRTITTEFASLGTNLLIVLPGRFETVGGAPPLLGETPRDLTIDDALALTRSPAIRRVAPIALGAAEVSRGGLAREVTIIGSTAELEEVRHLRLGAGTFLPAGRPHGEQPVAVLGARVREELFGGDPVLGQWLRIGDRRFRVIGTIDSRGRSIGLDLDEMVVIPVAAAQSMFNTDSLFRIMVEARSREAVAQARRAILDTLRRRHDGEEDVTIITQDAVLGTFDRVLRALTLGVGGIAAISLLVAGVLVMNVMLVSVTDRTGEIGLLKALGSPPRQILLLFLTEAAALSSAGGLAGLTVGLAAAQGVSRLYPVLSLHVPLWAAASAMGTALGTGLLFGVLPARRAAALEPVAALARR